MKWAVIDPASLAFRAGRVTSRPSGRRDWVLQPGDTKPFTRAVIASVIFKPCGKGEHHALYTQNSAIQANDVFSIYAYFGENLISKRRITILFFRETTNRITHAHYKPLRNLIF